jgi:hypothetical protein
VDGELGATPDDIDGEQGNPDLELGWYWRPFNGIQNHHYTEPRNGDNPFLALKQKALARGVELLYSYLRVNFIGICTCPEMNWLRTNHLGQKKA